MCEQNICGISREQLKLGKASYLAGAAYQLGLSVLWLDKTFPEQESETTETYIADYLFQSDDMRQAFIAMCERIILARLCRVKPDEPMPPARWFNPSERRGFAATFMPFCRVHDKRRIEPDYLRHISTLAVCFYRYASYPSVQTVNQGRNKLLALGAAHLLAYFQTTIRKLSYHRYL